MTGVCEDRAQALQDLSVVRVQQVPQPVQRLHNSHGRAPRPVHALRRNGLKDDSLFPHLDRPQPCVRENRHARRHGRRETAIICGGQAVDDDATLKFSRLLELRARDSGPFNYPIEVFTEWRGKAFYLNVRYRARSRQVEDDFVVRHTRMTLTGFGRFDLADVRHTDKWLTVYRGLTAADGFREIEENEIFWPTT
jgi:hypothetical protein